MECERCGANEEKFFYMGVCRRCIHLRTDVIEPDSGTVNGDLNLEFELTTYQKEVSNQLISFVEEGHSVYLKAVCGSGKTEMCLELISTLLRKGLKVGWTIPRRQVVLELGKRLSNYYPHLKVVSVCGGHSDDVWGDLIVCTTHQLYRYPDYFDVLILDEPDAFPYFENPMLHHLVKQSVRGPIVYLSATLEGLDATVKRLYLDLRPSNQLLPQPLSTFSLFSALRFLWRWRRESVLVFVPTKRLAKRVSVLMGCEYVTSDSVDKDAIIERFRKCGGFLVCTTVLERGVTFLDCFVVVLFADHSVFTTSSLIQIAGRVGRGMNPMKGAVVFWSRYKSEAVVLSCLRISKHNQSAQSVLKTFNQV